MTFFSPDPPDPEPVEPVEPVEPADDDAEELARQRSSIRRKRRGTSSLRIEPDPSVATPSADNGTTRSTSQPRRSGGIQIPT